MAPNRAFLNTSLIQNMTMKRNTGLVLMAALMLVLLLIAGCGDSKDSGATEPDDNPNWTEKQAIEHLYDYLVTKASHASYETNTICREFHNSHLDAFEEFTEGEGWIEELGTTVYVRICKGLLINTGVLKTLATYLSDGLWSVSVGGKWQLDEETGEVEALDYEALELLEEITPRTYANSEYAYSINYPPSWNLDDKDNEHILLRNRYAFTEVIVYEFTDKSMEYVVEFMANLSEEGSAYFELLSSQKIGGSDCLTGWSLEYLYKRNPDDHLMWERSHLWLTKDWSLYNVVVKVYDEYKDVYLAELEYIQGSFVISDNSVKVYTN